jgi:hypothetical protein
LIAPCEDPEYDSAPVKTDAVSPPTKPLYTTPLPPENAWASYVLAAGFALTVSGAGVMLALVLVCSVML